MPLRLPTLPPNPSGGTSPLRVTGSKFLPVFRKSIYLCSMSDREYIHAFSDYLFWDSDKSSIDLEANAPYVVRRVLEFGQFSDWNLLVRRYGISRICTIAQNFRTLDPKALSFISTVSSVPLESFRCFTTKQYTRTHWNF